MKGRQTSPCAIHLGPPQLSRNWRQKTAPTSGIKWGWSSEAKDRTHTRASPGGGRRIFPYSEQRTDLGLSLQGSGWLTEAVFAFDLIFRQTAYSGEGTAAVGYRDGYHDFIRAWRIVEADFHAIEVATHEGCVFMA